MQHHIDIVDHNIVFPKTIDPFLPLAFLSSIRPLTTHESMVGFTEPLTWCVTVKRPLHLPTSLFKTGAGDLLRTHVSLL